MKLYGKELEEELAKREQIRNKRRAARLTLKMAAQEKEMSLLEYSNYERGADVCPHEEFEDMAGGFPVPKFIFKQCKVCKHVDAESMQEVTDENMKRVYEVYKKVYGKQL